MLRERRGCPKVLVGLIAASGVALAPATVLAGAWTQGAGRLTLRETFGYWQTDRKFASSLDTELVFPGRGPVSAGARIPFDPVTGGKLRTLGFTTAATLGVLDWLDVGATLPLLWTDFDTAPVDTVDGRFGVGDLVLSAQALAFRHDRIALAGRTEWKLPTGAFDPSIYSAPLTEGQMDLAVYASAGVSLYPHGYANAEVGWKFRFKNAENKRDPGDELHFQVEGGVDLPYDLLVKVAFDGLLGQDGSLDRFGTRTELPRRRLFSVWAGLIWKASERLSLETAGRYLIAGEDFPTGFQLFVNAAYQFQVYGERRE